jgi:hypothetical protein
MFPCAFFGYSAWWICPVLMIAMIFMCIFFLMRKMHGMGTRMNCCMKSGAGPHDDKTRRGSD